MIELMTAKTTRPPAGNPDPDLPDLAVMTARMRALEAERVAISEKRRKRVVYLHSQNVSSAAMARAMNVTEAAVSKMIHGGPSKSAAGRRKATGGTTGG